MGAGERIHPPRGASRVRKRAYGERSRMVTTRLRLPSGVAQLSNRRNSRVGLQL